MQQEADYEREKTALIKQIEDIDDEKKNDLLRQQATYKNFVRESVAQRLAFQKELEGARAKLAIATRDIKQSGTSDTGLAELTKKEAFVGRLLNLLKDEVQKYDEISAGEGLNALLGRYPAIHTIQTIMKYRDKFEI